MRRPSIGVLVAIGLLLVRPVDAVEETRVDLQPIRSSANPLDVGVVTQSRPLGHLALGGVLFVDYTPSALSRATVGAGGAPVEIGRHRLGLQLGLALGLLDWLELGVVLPAMLAQSTPTVGASGLGDLRVTVKSAVPSLRRRALGVALSLGLTLPTGAADRFASDGAVSARPGLVVDYRSATGALIAFNLAFGMYPERAVGAELVRGPTVELGVGLAIPLAPRLGLSLVANALVGVRVTPARAGRDAIPEVLVACRWSPPRASGLALTVGGGGGGGELGAAIPSPRLFVSVGWVPLQRRESTPIERLHDGWHQAPAPAPLPVRGARAIAFRTDSDELTPDGAAAIVEAARDAHTRTTATVVIRGATGQEASTYFQHLAQRRAARVRAALIGLRIEEQRVSVRWVAVGGGGRPIIEVVIE